MTTKIIKKGEQVLTGTDQWSNNPSDAAKFTTDQAEEKLVKLADPTAKMVSFSLAD